MATNAQVGLGTILSRWDDGSSDWEEIAEVGSISFDGPQRNVVNVANLNTPDEYINKLQGMLDAGTLSAEIQYIKDQYTQLRTDMETRGNIMYQVKFPNLEGLEFEGFVSELPLDIVTDDSMKHSVTFTIDGKADFLSAVS